MKKGIGTIILIGLLLLVVIAGSRLYSGYLAMEAGKEAEYTITENVVKTEGSKHLRDKNLLYDDGNEVVTMYLTVRQGNASEGTDHTWEEINTYSAYYYDEKGIDRYKVEALLQVGDEKGIPAGNLGYGETVPNAIVQIRGQTSSRNDQKNYKIELKENQGSWKGQTTIALNKHMTDGLRYRNKMGFDLLSGIDQLMSLRTNFVHLYVNDLTDGSDDGFEDYGLYTQVEQLNKTALKNHGLDRTGHLYKINFFEFFRYEDVIKLNTDSGYNRTEFEKYLEIKGNEDHTKLIAMLEDVNNYGMPIEDVIDKHFDMENLAYWMAFNILTGNIDTQSRNTYLYSPQNLDTWYLYNWDLDAFFRRTENEIVQNQDAGSWDQGVSNYWGNVLFCRCLKSEKFRQELDAAILDLKSYLSYERLSSMTKAYEQVVKPYLYSEPDITYAPLTPENYDIVEKALPSLVDDYYQRYLESLEKPMPFYIDTPQKTNLGVTYTWGDSYDFDQEDITYKVIVARDLECTDVVYKYEGNWTSFRGDDLPEGQYFVRATATNESGFTQDAFDYYETEQGKEYGRLCIYVDAQGNITRYTVVE
ncbi:CotH kinase family protein [Butyrivibrio sp. AE2032]|uniref:CotH kinase family protein n=1 Tax=Butyrivibrio sp. AE2032 TaxID=1458463 RepID=UPI0005522D47|nr:CotH kinase family protein [Butyrivibrio sp. AE2032]